MKHKLFLFILPFLVLGLHAQTLVPDNTAPHVRLMSASAIGSSDQGGKLSPKKTPANIINNNLATINANPGSGTPSMNLNPTFSYFNVCGMNFAYGSVMTQTRSRGSGLNTNGTGFPATINISGIPTTCTVILQAYLYYEASYTEGSMPASSNADITPPGLGSFTAYPSHFVAYGPQKCWGENGTVTYRTDVTTAVNAAIATGNGGNGAYTINNLTGFTNPSGEVDGCTLMIIYQTGPTTGTTGNLFIIDGNAVENLYYEDYLQLDSVYGIPVCTNTIGNSESFEIVADATNDPSNYTVNVETAHKVTQTFPNSMWNFNFINTPMTTNAAANNTFYPYRNDDPTMSAFAPYDCYNFIMLGMYFQTTGCTNCEPTIGGNTVSNITCNGSFTGSITANISGGTIPYTYTWSTGATTSSITGLSAGTYTLNVEDIICNTAQSIITITQPPPIIDSVSTSGTNIKCNGNSNGAITVITYSGGNKPYTYSWSNGKTTSSISGLSAGTYTLTVTDKGGCTETASTILTQPTSIGSATSVTSAITCNGYNNGTASINVTGGVSPYTYTWSPSGGTNSSATGLSAGTYTVTVTDNNGCGGASASATVVLTQPTPVGLSSTISSGVSCNGGSNGTATITPSGGLSPYTYSWSPGGQTTASVSGLSSGTYTVTVTDNNGCGGASSTSTVVITQPSAVGFTTNISNGVSCNGGSNGIATITTSGGVSPYTYTWSPGGQTTATATGLSAGTYTVTVKDNNGCSGTATTSTVVITQPAAVGFTTSISSEVSCNGGNSGIATITTSGGVTPYTYTWSPAGGTNSTASGLSAGTYTITVTDNNGCSGTSSTLTIVITQPTPFSTNINAVNATCGIDNGSATVSVSGSTSPYTYLWNPSGQTNSMATGLGAGSYTVTVKDAHGCSTTASITVTQTSSVVATLSGSTGVSCYGGNNGTATVTTTGGTSPYTYTWSHTGGTNATGTGLTAGTYTITVVDAQGCTSTATTTVVITQPTAVTASTSSNTGVSCNGYSNGTVTLTTTGGTSPYTYSWNPTGQTNATATGLSAGTYTVTVTDKNGCTTTSGTVLVTVTQPSVVTVTTTANTGTTCNGYSNGTVTLTTTGGTSPYTYLWNPTGQTNATATGLSAGTYTVTVTDKNGCTPTSGTVKVIVTQPSVVTVTIASNTGTSCYGGNNATVTLTTSGGTSPYTYSWNPTGQTNATATGLSAGTYTVTVTDKNGCTPTSGTVTVIVTQPTAVTVAITSNTGVSCNGGSNATVTLTTSGGTSPYTYLWKPGNQTNATATGLSAGTYTVTVTDKNGCTTTSGTILVTVTQPSVVKVTITSNTGTSCNGYNNGTVSLSATGGTSPYTYLWNPSGQTNATATGLSAGTYTVTITDNNGCTPTNVTTLVVVTQPAVIKITTTVNTGTTCNGYSNGTVTLSTTGGTSPYTYSWSPTGQTTATVTGLSAGTYTVTVTDKNGCTPTSGTILITVTQPSVVTVTTTGTGAISCYGGKNGTITLTTTGGTPPYTYLWSPTGQTNATATGLSAGTYTVTVKDKNGCTPTSNTVIVTITQPTPVTTSISGSTSITCNGGNNGTITLTTSGGASPYTYLWSPTGGTNATGTGLSAGTYTVTITDKNGCTTTSATIITVTQPLAVKPIITVTSQVSCNGDENGNISVTSLGGASPYTYLWSLGSTNTSITGLSAGTYTVLATDKNGCTGTAIVTLTQPSLITVSISSTTTGDSACLKQHVTLSASGANTYKWSNGQTTSSINVIILPTNHDTAIYWVKGYVNGCYDSTSIAIKIIQPLTSFTIQGGNNTVCPGIATTLTAVATGENVTYKWSNGATTSSITVSDNVTTTYTAIVYGVCDTAVATQTVTVYPQPTIGACCNTKILIGEDTTITAFGPEITKYTWEPQNTLNPDTGRVVIASPTVTTTYTVTGIDANGCAVDTTITIIIEIPCNFKVPNVFTPTYAGVLGVDDKFYINTAYLESWSIIIYDRWGKEMYNSTNPNESWTGTTESGSTVPAGVYYYIINAGCQGRNIQREGYVQLIR